MRAGRGQPLPRALAKERETERDRQKKKRQTERDRQRETDNGGRVCSGTAPKQGEDAVEAGAGWIDLAKIARNLGMSEDHVKHAWAPLATALR